MISRDWIVPNDAVNAANRAIENVGIPYRLDHIESQRGVFFSAWVLTKLTEPVRGPLAVVLTPSLSRKLRDWFAHKNVRWSGGGMLGLVGGVLLAEIAVLLAIGGRDEGDRK